MKIIVRLWLKEILTFSQTEVHARSVGPVIQCDKFDKWRLMFSERKLSQRQRKQIEDIINDISYSCGTTTEDLVLPDELSSVCVRKHDCSDHIEKNLLLSF